jgi:hypothetical protein
VLTDRNSANAKIPGSVALTDPRPALYSATMYVLCQLSSQASAVKLTFEYFNLFLQYELDKSTYVHSAGRFSAKVKSPSGTGPLNLGVSFYASGSVRVKLSEGVPRWQVGLCRPPLRFNAAIM